MEDDELHLVVVQRPLWTAHGEAMGGRHGELDRRLRERRTTGRSAAVDRRRRHRRRPRPNPSGVLGFHMVRRQDAPPVSPGRRGRAERPLAIRRVRRPPHPIALTTPSQALYEVALSAVRSPAWRAAFLRPLPALTPGRYTPELGRLGLEGARVTFRTSPPHLQPVAAPDRPLDRVCQLGGGGVTDAWLRAGSES